MAKQGEKPKEVSMFRTLDKQEIKWLQEDIDKAGGEDQWLVAEEAIVIRPDGSRAVVMTGGGKIPYNECKNKLEQLYAHKARIQFAEDHEIFRKTGIDQRSERMKRVFLNFRGLSESKKVE